MNVRLILEQRPGLLEQADIIISLRYEGSGRAAELIARTERGAAVIRGLPLLES